MNNGCAAQRFAVIDCETDPFDKGQSVSPFIWGFYDGIEYKQYESTDQLAAYLTKHAGVVYAHNGGKFDFHFLIPYFDTDSPIRIVHGRILTARIGNCELRDSYALIPSPLSAFAKDEFDYSLMHADERDKPENRKAIEHYLRKDCKYLWEWVTKHLQTLDCGKSIPLTAASGAMKEYLRTSGQKRKQISIQKATHFEYFKPYYYGGRCQAIVPGYTKGPVYVYDLNSAYSRAMYEDHPCGKHHTLSDDITDIKPESFVTLSALSKGAFCTRLPTGGIDFPRRKGVFHVTGHEFLTGVTHDLVKDIEIIQIINQSNRISFRNYIDKWYTIKQTSDNKALKITAKLMLNSLYGKFATNPENYQEYKLIHQSLIEANMLEGWNFTQIAPEDMAWINRAVDMPESMYFDLSVAASITGFVRAMLIDAISSTRAIYCDTDSVFTLDPLPDHLLGDDLGQWKLEYTASDAYIGGKKLYALFSDNDKPKTASKGARLTPGQIKRVVNGETIRYTQDAPSFRMGTQRPITREIRATFT